MTTTYRYLDRIAARPPRGPNTFYEVSGIVAGITTDRYLTSPFSGYYNTLKGMASGVARIVYELRGIPAVIERQHWLQDNVGVGTVVRAPIATRHEWHQWPDVLPGVDFYDPKGTVEDPLVAERVHGRQARTLEVLAAPRYRAEPAPRPQVRHRVEVTGADHPVQITEATHVRGLAATITAAHRRAHGEEYVRAIEDTEQALRALIDQLDGADPTDLSAEDAQALVLAWLAGAALNVGVIGDEDDDVPVETFDADTDPEIRLTDELRPRTLAQVHADTRTRLAALTRGAVTIDAPAATIGEVLAVPVPLGDPAWADAPDRRMSPDGTTTALGVVVAIVEEYTMDAGVRTTIARTVTAQPAP